MRMLDKTLLLEQGREQDFIAKVFNSKMGKQGNSTTQAVEK